MIEQATGIGTLWRALLIALAVFIAHNGRTPIGAEVGGVAAAAVVVPQSGNGVPMELCPLFGGSCCRNCSLVLTHRWNIALCIDPLDQCCISEQCAQEAITSQRPVEDVARTRTECETEGGTCQAWYHQCDGVKVARRCGFIWQSCCNTTKIDGDIVGGGGSATPKRENGGGPWLSWRSEAGQRGRSRYPGASEATKAHDEEQQDNESAPSEQSPTASSCGVMPSSTNDHGQSVAEWPWQAHIETESGNAYCSGVVVDRLWVLTSASCFKGLTSENLASHRVVIGRRNSSSTGSGYQTFAISAIIRHPLYGEIYHKLQGHRENGANGDASQADSAQRPEGASDAGDALEETPCGRPHHQRAIRHDQAMLKVAEAITFNEYASPVCLPKRRTRLAGHVCAATGLLRHTRRTHNHHNEALIGADAQAQRPTHHVARGRMHDAITCSRLTGDATGYTRMCFEREHNEVLPQLRSGAFVTCQSDEGQHDVVAALSPGSLHSCHGNAVSIVNAQSMSPYWIRSVIESSADTSGEEQHPTVERGNAEQPPERN